MDGTTDYMSEEQVIINALRWLDKMAWVRDKDLGKASSKSAAYAATYIRTIQRTKNFIERKPENVQWLHDYLMEDHPNNELFLTFFKLWSKADTDIRNSLNKTIEVEIYRDVKTGLSI